MNDATRARIVRGWLLLAAITVGWLLWPSWFWLLPVALFMPPLAAGFVCGACSDGTGPTSFQIEVAGITNDGSGSCTCTDHNGTFELATPTSILGGTRCFWNNTFSPLLCYITPGEPTGDWTVRYLIAVSTNGHITIGGGPSIEVFSAAAGTGGNRNCIYWYNTYGAAPDCRSLSAESIAFVSNAIGGVGGECDSDGTAVLVTSL